MELISLVLLRTWKKGFFYSFGNAGMGGKREERKKAKEERNTAAETGSDRALLAFAEKFALNSLVSLYVRGCDLMGRARERVTRENRAHEEQDLEECK